MNILPAAPTTIVRTEYTSVLRPLDPETKGFLWQYGVSTGQEGFRSEFQDELLIREDGQDYWVPVPAADVQPSLLSLAQGQQLALRVRLLGSLETEEGLRIIFVVTDLVP